MIKYITHSIDTPNIIYIGIVTTYKINNRLFSN